ncbi:flagellar basal body rod protein FlgB [Glacieibacterium frigidum]|uniref:Flagellar basal body rod protein FlgB n=1 Tax=Glacieibacterium frigidum TaxID=2593303 RepID=A0A552UEM4_9SPHN|nr:flagellar basal body protein [Glacieibacterium frigidum]TRW16687.1 flagellar basal body rod protein FlgB [Glacieibacterium frigidum]
MTTPDPLFGIHGRALEVRQARLGLLASNIANAATPGFKARDLDFRAALDGAKAERYRIPVQASLDGNSVELSVEQAQFAQNAVQYRTTLAFLNGRVGTIMTALRGGE